MADGGRVPFSPALGFSGRDWFAELHARRRCWVGALLVDVPPLPLGAAAAARRPPPPIRGRWSAGDRAAGGRLSAELRRLRRLCPVPADGCGTDTPPPDDELLPLELPPPRAGCAPVDGAAVLPGDQQLSALELEPESGLLPSRLLLPCPLLPDAAAATQPPPLPAADRLPLRDLQDPLLDDCGRLLSDDEFSGWESSTTPLPAAAVVPAPAELPPPELAPLPLPPLLALTELSYTGGAAAETAPEPVARPGAPAGRETPGGRQVADLHCHPPPGAESGAGDMAAPRTPVMSSPAGARVAKETTTTSGSKGLPEMELRPAEKVTASGRPLVAPESGACKPEEVVAVTVEERSAGSSEPPDSRCVARPLEERLPKQRPVELVRPRPVCGPDSLPALKESSVTKAAAERGSGETVTLQNSDTPAQRRSDIATPSSPADLVQKIRTVDGRDSRDNCPLIEHCNLSKPATKPGVEITSKTTSKTISEPDRGHNTDIGTDSADRTVTETNDVEGCGETPPPLQSHSAVSVDLPGLDHAEVENAEAETEAVVEEEAESVYALEAEVDAGSESEAEHAEADVDEVEAVDTDAETEIYDANALPSPSEPVAENSADCLTPTPSQCISPQPMLTVKDQHLENETEVGRRGSPTREAEWMPGEMPRPASLRGVAEASGGEAVIPPETCGDDGGSPTNTARYSGGGDGGGCDEYVVGGDLTCDQQSPSPTPANGSGDARTLAVAAAWDRTVEPSADSGAREMAPFPLQAALEPPTPLPSAAGEVAPRRQVLRAKLGGSIFSPSCALTLDEELSPPPPPPRSEKTPLVPGMRNTAVAQQTRDCRLDTVDGEAVVTKTSDLSEATPDWSPVHSALPPPSPKEAPQPPRQPPSATPGSAATPCRHRPGELSPPLGEPPAKLAHWSGHPVPPRTPGDAPCAGGQQPPRQEERPLSGAEAFLAVLSARVQSRAARVPPASRRGRPLMAGRAARRPALTATLGSRWEPRARPPGERETLESGTSPPGRHVDVTLDETTLRCLACLAARGDELTRQLKLGRPFTELEPDSTRLMLKRMCGRVSDQMASPAERQGLLVQYRHTLAVHGLAKSRQLAVHLSATGCLRQLQHFSRTHADILHGCLDGVIARLDSLLSGGGVRHPRVAALLTVLTDTDLDAMTGPVLIVTEPAADLAEELCSALAEVPDAEPILLRTDESTHRLDEALRRRGAVLVLVSGADPPARWPLARCALVVPLLGGGPAADAPLLARCRAAAVPALELAVRPDWETVYRRLHDGAASPPASPAPAPPPPQRSHYVVACAAAAERWDLHRLAELSGSTVTVITRDYSGLRRVSAPSAAEGEDSGALYPDLVLAADTCLLVRALTQLARPDDGERLATEVRALRRQAALCWLLLVGRRPAAAAADNSREEAVVRRLRALLAPVCRPPEYTVRLVRATSDGLLHSLLDIVRELPASGAPGGGRPSDPAPDGDASSSERRLLRLPSCNAVSADLLLRRAGGLPELRAAPLGRLVQLMPELPVRILADLQRHLQRPLPTAATSGGFSDDRHVPHGRLDIAPPPQTPSAAHHPMHRPTASNTQQYNPGMLPPSGYHHGTPGGRNGPQPGCGRQWDRGQGGPRGWERGPVLSAEDGAEDCGEDGAGGRGDDWLIAPRAEELLAAEADWADEQYVYDASPPMETSQ